MLGAFAAGHAVVVVREHLIDKQFDNGVYSHTREWVALCSACAKPDERASATKEDFCRACAQQLPRGWSSYPLADLRGQRLMLGRLWTGQGRG